jgi:hypothetical protein
MKKIEIFQHKINNLHTATEKFAESFSRTFKPVVEKVCGNCASRINGQCCCISSYKCDSEVGLLEEGCVNHLVIPNGVEGHQA